MYILCSVVKRAINAFERYIDFLVILLRMIKAAYRILLVLNAVGERPF